MELEVCEVQVTNLGASRESPGVPAGMRRALAAELQYEVQPGAISPCSEPGYRPQPLVRVQLRAYLHPSEDIDRTYLLDGLFVLPGMGLWPITPAWGRATVRAHVHLESEGRHLEPIILEVSAPFSMVFYAWYRTGPIEEAYRKAYGEAFRELGRRVARRIREDVAPRASVAFVKPRGEASAAQAGAVTATAAVAPPSEEPAPLPVAVPAMEPEVALALRLLEPRRIDLPEEGVRIVVEPPERPMPSPGIGLWLGALGGLEVSRTGGVARVSSSANTEFFGLQEVGSGEAITSGWGVSLSRPPDRTGFYWPARAGFFSQDIEIRGFRDDLPALRGQRAGDARRDIAAVATDPRTGELLDAGEPLAYFLRLRSGYVGQGIGFNFVFGGDALQLFATTEASLNALEVRHTDVTIDGNREKGYAVVPFGAFQAAGQIGIAIPALHLAIRASGEVEWFRNFDYPEPLEFRAGLAYNQRKDVLERQRVFVQGASLVTAHGRLSVMVYY